MMYPYNSYSYSYGYGNNGATSLVIILLVAVILAIVLNFTFLSKKNEGKYKGALGKIYNFLCFNKFYVEEIFKLIYIITAVVITVIGLIMLFNFNFIVGLLIIIIANVLLRITYELIMMFIILCRKTVSIDKRLDKISKFYSDDFDSGLNESDRNRCCVEECFQCDGKVDDIAEEGCNNCCTETPETCEESCDVTEENQEGKPETGFEVTNEEDFEEKTEADTEDKNDPPINTSDR